MARMRASDLQAGTRLVSGRFAWAIASSLPSSICGSVGVVANSWAIRATQPKVPTRWNLPRPAPGHDSAAGRSRGTTVPPGIGLRVPG